MPKRIDSALIPPSPTLIYESALWKKGLSRVVGLDEAGRGALCGPIVGAAVILPSTDPDLLQHLAGVRDSKQLKPAERECLEIKIKKIALDFGIGLCTHDEIDALGMGQVGRLVFLRALQELEQPPEHLLLDYFSLPQSSLPQTSLVKGDQRSLSIASASILAKTARDRLLTDLDQQFPCYGLAHNKGYGTCAHLKAIREHGICPIHRKSFTNHLFQEQLFESEQEN